MKDVTTQLKNVRKKNLQVHIGNLEKSLSTTSDSSIRKSLETMISNARQALEKLEK